MEVADVGESKKDATENGKQVGGAVTSKKMKLTRSQWITSGVMAFTCLGAGCIYSLQAPFFPKEAESKGATPIEYGLVFGVFEMVVFISSHFMGKLISRTGPKILLVSGPLAQAIACFCFGVLDKVNGRHLFIGLAFSIRVVEGIGASAQRVASNCMAAAVFPERVGTIVAFWQSISGIGVIIGPPVGGALYDVAGFGAPFYVTGSLLLLAAILSYFFLPNPAIPTKSEDKGNKKIADWKKIWFYPSTIVYAFVLFAIYYYLGFNGATMEPHLRPDGFSSTDVGLLYSILAVVFIVVCPISGWLCDKKCDSMYLCMIGCITMIMSLLLIGPMPFLGLERTWGVFAAAMSLFGLTCALQIATIFRGILKITLRRGFPEDYSTYGLVSAVVTASNSFGAFIGPTLGGYLMDVLGYNFCILLILVLEIFVFVSLVVFTISSKFRKAKTKHPIVSISVKPSNIKKTAMDGFVEVS